MPGRGPRSWAEQTTLKCHRKPHRGPRGPCRSAFHKQGGASLVVTSFNNLIVTQFGDKLLLQNRQDKTARHRAGGQGEGWQPPTPQVGCYLFRRLEAFSHTAHFAPRKRPLPLRMPAPAKAERSTRGEQAAAPRPPAAVARPTETLNEGCAEPRRVTVCVRLCRVSCHRALKSDLNWKMYPFWSRY